MIHSIRVNNTMSIFFISSFRRWFILRRIFITVHLNNDVVLHSNRYNTKKISTVMYFIFLLQVTLSKQKYIIEVMKLIWKPDTENK